MSVVKMADMRLNMITEQCSHLDDIVTPLISNRWVPIEDELLPNLSRHLRTGLSHIKFLVCASREAVKNYFADFFCFFPYPLNGKSFCQKPLAERGGTPPPFNGKSPKKFLKKWVKKG